jgi:hypothetical protein
LIRKTHTTKPERSALRTPVAVGLFGRERIFNDRDVTAARKPTFARFRDFGDSVSRSAGQSHPQPRT